MAVVGIQTQYDPTREVAGVVPILSDGRLVLVASRKHQDYWILPKGGVEGNETLEQAAVREAWEEAGIKGTINGAGVSFFHTKVDSNRNPVCRFTFFPCSKTA
ncbi:NUDIX hydrolase domain-like protein [Chytridium lagenaria]|nr:NUDIX hydrolase domain-like protein [Chytridium lagenaria]